MISIVSSRPGPTPIAEIGAPDISSSALHVLLRVLRQVVEGLGLGDVLGPARQRLVDRLGVVEVGLAVRQFLDPLAVDLVRHADRDPLPAGEHVELGEEEVGEAVDPGRVAGDDRVEPAAAAVTAGGDAALAADAAQRLAVLVEQLGRERARRRRGWCTP